MTSWSSSRASSTRSSTVCRYTLHSYIQLRPTALIMSAFSSRLTVRRKSACARFSASLLLRKWKIRSSSLSRLASRSLSALASAAELNLGAMAAAEGDRGVVVRHATVSCAAQRPR